MRVTLAQYQLLTPEERERVTHIEAGVADEYDEKLARVRMAIDDDWDDKRYSE